jgi:hypothetical protein
VTNYFLGQTLLQVLILQHDWAPHLVPPRIQAFCFFKSFICNDIKVLGNLCESKINIGKWLITRMVITRDHAASKVVQKLHAVISHYQKIVQQHALWQIATLVVLVQPLVSLQLAKKLNGRALRPAAHVLHHLHQQFRVINEHRPLSLLRAAFLAASSGRPPCFSGMKLEVPIHKIDQATLDGWRLTAAGGT